MTKITNFVWNPVDDCVISELDGTGAVQAVYTNEPQQYGGAISQRRGTATSTYHADSLGTTRALTDSTGNVTDTYLNDAWGNSVAATGTTVNPYRWVGQYGYYTDNSTALVYVRARIYQPTVARWTSIDPLGFMEGMNIYVMVKNIATRVVDPTGLFCVPLTTTITGPTSSVFEDGGSHGLRISFTTEILFAEPCCDCDFRPYVKCNYDIAFIFPDGTVIKGPTPGRKQDHVFREDCDDMNRDGTIQRWECYGAHRPLVLRPNSGAVDEWSGCQYRMKDEPADAYFDLTGPDLLEKIANDKNGPLPKPLPQGIKVKFCMSCAFKQIVTDTATGAVVWSRIIDAGIPYPNETQRTVCRTDPLVIRRKVN